MMPGASNGNNTLPFILGITAIYEQAPAQAMQTADLNLVVYLDALIQHGSATRAAEALGVSQPGVSAALRRLRELLDDPVMIRSGRRLVPTPRAADLHARMAGALALWRSLGPGQATPHERLYSILASDYVQLTLVPALAHRLEREAPHATIRVVPTNPFRRLQMVAAREVDFAIGYYHEAPDELRVRRLFEEDMVCVMRADHPAAARFGLDDFLAHPHVGLMSVSAGSYGDTVERALLQQGAVRRVAITVPSYAVAPRIVLQTDYLAILPRSIAVDVARVHPLAIRPLPVELPVLDVSIFYHELAQNDPENRWFRELVASVSEGLVQTHRLGAALASCA
jgi:DNA-binding transcriptional LysR family regulator